MDHEFTQKKNAQMNSLQLQKCKSKLESSALIIADFSDKITLEDFFEAWHSSPHYKEQNTEISKRIADLESDISCLLMEVQEIVDIINF